MKRLIIGDEDQNLHETQDAKLNEPPSQQFQFRVNPNFPPDQEDDYRHQNPDRDSESVIRHSMVQQRGYRLTTLRPSHAGVESTIVH